MTRKRNQKVAQGLVVIALTLLMTSAQAAGVIVSNILDDGFPTLFTGSVSQTGTSDEMIALGLNNFRADGGSIVTQSAVDTLFMTITAPAGFFITSITYEEKGTGLTGDGFAAATGSMVVDGTPVNFLSQIFGPNTSSSWTISPMATPVANKLSIDMSITNSLVAFVFDAGPAIIEKTEASVMVGLTAIPIPPAIWMMGAAVAALVTVARRRSA